MDTTTVKQQVKKFFESDPFYSEVVPRDFTEDMNLLDAGLLDSIGLLNFVIFIENTYGIQVDIADLNDKNFANLVRIADYICTHSNQKT